VLLAGADGITLGGKGIVLRGATATNSIFKNSQTGGRQFFADENMTATNVVIADNPGSHIASRASKSVHSAVATGAQVKRRRFCWRHFRIPAWQHENKPFVAKTGSVAGQA